MMALMLKEAMNLFFFVATQKATHLCNLGWCTCRLRLGIRACLWGSSCTCSSGLSVEGTIVLFCLSTTRHEKGVIKLILDTVGGSNIFAVQ